MTTTSLYIPFTDFRINDKAGEMTLYENLVQSGPSYSLVVHESPSWLEIKDKMPWPEMITIIPTKNAEEYKQLAIKFFSPVTESIPYYTDGKDQKHPPENLTADLRRALSYILIAHDFKARVYEDDILKSTARLSDILKKHTDVFSEEAISRVVFVENLLSGYRREHVPTLSVNKDRRIFNDLVKLLKEEKIKALSEKNDLFAVAGIKKDLLKKEIQKRLTEILSNKWFPYLIGGTTAVLCYYASLKDLEGILTFLSGLGTKVLSEYDFRDRAPPIQSPELFVHANTAGIITFSYQPFNDDWKIFIPSRT